MATSRIFLNIGRNLALNIVLKLLAGIFLLTWHSMIFAGVFLTESERAWLVAHPDIRVAISPDYPPLSYIGTHGQITGLEQDYLKLMERRLGVKFKQVVLTLAERAANTPTDKQVDMVAIFAASQARLQNWAFTKPYLDLPVYLITRQNASLTFSLENTQQQAISVVSHYASYAFLQQQYPAIKIDAVNDTCTGLQHVSIGGSGGMLADLPVANWCINHDELNNLKIMHASGFHYKMGLAVRKDWPVLLTILDKGLASITPLERDEIY